ncbi:TraR/DksA family transcriptional regulator [Shimia thalassica]|uniref:TraR/DksA family transcriptional regulator n=1 Tax=Shimia thalassica TaxID=1715693 RepID=UPI0034E56385
MKNAYVATPSIQQGAGLTYIKALGCVLCEALVQLEEIAMIDLAKQKKSLLKRLSELDSRLHAIEAELEAPHSKDWEELAVEREGDEVLEQLGQSGQDEILRIRAALKRLRDGEYGICVRCGDDIAAERLNILPDAPLCNECATAVAG